MQLIKIGYNHDTGRKFGNLIVVLKKKFSSVSARKLKCPGSARNLLSSGSLEPENSSSNSSLVGRYIFLVVTFSKIICYNTISRSFLYGSCIKSIFEGQWKLIVMIWLLLFDWFCWYWAFFKYSISSSNDGRSSKSTCQHVNKSWYKSSEI